MLKSIFLINLGTSYNNCRQKGVSNLVQGSSFGFFDSLAI